MTQDRRKLKHWYRIFVGECPVCGRDSGYKERIYGKRPTDPLKRYVYLSDKATYCGCDR